MHFPPVSDFPLFPKNVSDTMENFPNFAFSIKIFRFSSAKNFWWPFLVIHYKFRICPLFLLFQYISPYFQKIIISFYFCKFRHPPDFIKFTCFFCILFVFRFSLVWPWYIYASHNARTGHPCTKVKCQKQLERASDFEWRKPSKWLCSCYKSLKIHKMRSPPS